MTAIRDIEAMMKAVGTVVLDHLKHALTPIKERLSSLEHQVKEIPAGANGFDLESFDLSLKEDGRTLVFSFKDDKREVVKELTLPVLLDAGQYKAGSYQKGDGVTHGGSFWIAQSDTDSKPGESPDWRLAVKKGRDGTNRLS